MPTPAGLLDVGRLGRAHGIKGAIVVSLSSDRTERLQPGARLFDGSNWLVVESSRAQPHSRWVVQFESIHDRSAAETFTGRTLWAEPIDDADALWVHELIGCTVREVDGRERGVCVAVIDNPAHDILELDTGHLVPVAFVVAAEAGSITIDPPDGLFDLLD